MVSILDGVEKTKPAKRASTFPQNNKQRQTAKDGKGGIVGRFGISLGLYIVPTRRVTAVGFGFDVWLERSLQALGRMAAVQRLAQIVGGTGRNTRPAARD